jgi:predicted nucleotidyltransferase
MGIKGKHSMKVNARNPHVAKRPVDAEKVLQTFFNNHKEVILAYLFGSFVNRKNGRFHDIDIGVLLDPEAEEVLDKEMPYGYQSSLSTEIAHKLKYDLVDVVILNHASPLLLRRIISTGKLIFCRSESQRMRFEVTSLKRFSDTKQIRKIKRFYMEQRIKKGLSAYG